MMWILWLYPVITGLTCLGIAFYPGSIPKADKALSERETRILPVVVYPRKAGNVLYSYRQKKGYQYANYRSRKAG